jgi:hypothetical protein
VIIAYQDENCLRDLIAAPSILALGLASREEAMVNLESFESEDAPSKQKPRTTPTLHQSHENGEFAGNHGAVKPRRIPYHILQSTLAAAVALFYSKNPVSLMIRTALGGSF